MPRASIYVLASLISSVSAALILASGPSYTESRSSQSVADSVKGGPSTYNGCRDGSCRIAYLNSVEDFCLWAPSQPTLSTGSTEHTLDAWCIESVHGSRLIPDGTITGARLVITPEYVQVTGVGKLTNMNVPVEGIASASGQGHGIHGLVFTSVYGQLERIYDWTSFVSQERFCFRACKPSTACPQIHDVLGCWDNVLGNYDVGVFEDCIVDATEGSSTLHQDVLSHSSARPVSHCTTRGSIGNPHARRGVAPILVTPLSHLRLPLGQRVQVTSCMVPMTMDTATTTITSPSSLSTLNTTVSTNSGVFSTNAPTFTPCAYNHTRSHRHTHTHRHTHHRHSASSSSSSDNLSSHSPTASWLNNSSTYSVSSPTSSTPSFRATSSDPVPSTSNVTLTPIPASSPTSSLPTSSYGTSSSFSGTSSPPPPSLYSSSIPSSVASSSVSPSVMSSISSQTSSDATISPTSSPLVSPSTQSSPSTSSEGSDILTPSSSGTTASLTSSSPTVPNSQTQIGSCPPLMNAGFVSSTPLIFLMLAILMIVSSVDVLVF